MKRRYFYYAGSKLTAYRTKYQNNGRLAIVLCAKDKYDGDPVFGIVTVNLDDGLELKEDEAYLDTNNCLGIDVVFMETGLAVPTGLYGRSGFCKYPLFKFDLSKLPEA